MAAKETTSFSMRPRVKRILAASADLAQVSRSQFVELAVVALARQVAAEVSVDAELAAQAEERADRIHEAFSAEAEETET